jgi:hypothetical protein
MPILTTWSPKEGTDVADEVDVSGAGVRGARVDGDVRAEAVEACARLGERGGTSRHPRPW